MLTGLWIGLGFQAKYTNAAELISFALFLLLVPSKRRLLLSGKMFLLLGTFAVWLCRSFSGMLFTGGSQPCTFLREVIWIGDSR